VVAGRQIIFFHTTEEIYCHSPKSANRHR